MINTKRLFLVAVVITATIVLSFNEKKTSFEEDYLDFFWKLDEAAIVIEEGGDTSYVTGRLIEAGNRLNDWIAEMAAEDANRWDTFENAEAWPNPWPFMRCKFHCTYEYWQCKNLGEGDLFMCLAAYNECIRRC